MATPSNLTAQAFIPAQTTLDEGRIFRLANDGNHAAAVKLAGGEGGPDYVFTGTSAGAETDNFTVPFATLLKQYAAQVSGSTTLMVKARISSRSAAVATSGYWESYQLFEDIAGTMTAVGTQVDTVAIEGGATTNPALTVIATNTLQVAVAVLAVAQIRIELYVYQIQ